MAKQKDKLSIFILICFIVFFFLGIRKSFQQRTQERALMESFQITSGSFVDCGVGKTADFGQYSFILNDKVYNKYFDVDKFCLKPTLPFCTELKKHKFPVAYNPANPTLNQMLLSKRDFMKFKTKRADSLSVVYEKFFDCN